MQPNKFDYIFVLPHSLTVVMHFRFFCNNYRSNIKAKLVYHLNSRSEVNGKQKSRVMSSLISGSTPTQSSCFNFEHDMQQIHMSPLAEIRKISRQKIHSSSSSSFFFSLLFVSCIFDVLWIFSLWTCFLLYFMVILVFFKLYFDLLWPFFTSCLPIRSTSVASPVSSFYSAIYLL